jgi:hypothetical protein
VFYIEKGKYLELNQVKLSNVYAIEGAMLYSVSSAIYIKISKSEFICQNMFNKSAVASAINVYDPNNSTIVQPSTYLQYSIFYISEAV